MAQWHSVDLTDFDVLPAARTAREFSQNVSRTTVGLAKEATYVSVGLGLLAYQRIQVARRDVERSLRR